MTPKQYTVRNNLIYKAYKQGHSIKRLSLEYSLSKQRIEIIIYREVKKENQKQDD